MRKIPWFCLLICAVLLAACSNAPTVETGSAMTALQLTRYATQTLTPTVTSTPVNAPTATLAPTQTPTPRAYSVKDNDTMIGIAFRNGLTLDELKTANPSVDPYLLSVGMTLYIPAPSNITPTAQAPTPTAVPLQIGVARCLSSSTGGSYCFATLANSQDFDLGSISAEFRLTDPASGSVLTQPATLPVTRVVPGSAVVLFAYFAPPVYANASAVLQVLTAIQAGESSTLPVVSLAASEVQLAADGLSAAVSGQVALSEGSVNAQTVWVTAAAFDANGQVIGVRRVELPGTLNDGENNSFNLTVYPLAGKIDHVELYLDAIP